MSYQSHTRIYYMLLAYNCVSLILAVALAILYFFGFFDAAKYEAFTAFRLLWRKLRLPGQREDLTTDYTPVKITWASLTLSTLGSLLIALLAPFLTAISLRKQYHQDINLWVIIQQWSTRPRATCLIFPIVALLGAGNEPHTTNGFVITAMTSMISEVPLSLFRIKFLLDQSRQSNPPADVRVTVYVGPFYFPITTSKDPYTDLQFYTKQFIVLILVFSGIGAGGNSISNWEYPIHQLARTQATIKP